MNTSRRLRYPLAAGALATTALLLWPIPGSDRWDIRIDQDALAGKRTYLNALQPATAGAPNILLMVADDLGRHDVGFHGSAFAVTPHLDDLARSSTVFASAYATAAICAPSRAALLTGRVQNRFGFESQPMQRYVRNLGEYLGFRYLIDTDAMQPFLLASYPKGEQLSAQGLPGSEITLAEIFQRLGYRTGIFGKWHLGYATGNHPLRFGFDVQYGFQEAFSLYAEPGRPDIRAYHHDLFWEKHIWEMGRSGPSAISRNGNIIRESRYLTDAIAEEAITFIDESLDAGKRFFAYVPFSAPHTPFQARQEDYEALDGIGDPNRRVYAAMIRRLDHAVGRLIAHLEARDVLRNTLVVFTSDNGGADYTGATDNGPLRGGKFTQFEGGLAVPLLLRLPASAQARQPARIHRPVLLTDLFATLLDAAEAPVPDDRSYDSVNLFEPSTARRTLAWRSDFNGTIRSGPWKLIRNRRQGSTALFNLSEDPGESRDLSRSHPDRVADMLAAFERWQEDLHEPLWPRVMNYRYEDESGVYWFAI